MLQFFMFLEQFYQICDSIQPDKNGCMNWPGTHMNKYASVGVRGGRYQAHRLALERKLGRPIKKNRMACHHCDNPRCVNPSHLYEGTIKSNWKDAIRRGRIPSKGRWLFQK